MKVSSPVDVNRPHPAAFIDGPLPNQRPGRQPGGGASELVSVWSLAFSSLADGRR